jgi:hypothetical protein
MPTAKELPIDVMERLLEFAKRLPEESRSSFLQRVLLGLEALGTKYENTVVYAALGWLAGELVDHIFSVHIPLVNIPVYLTLNHASEAGALTGILAGFYQDCKKGKEREEVAEIVGRELRRALGKEMA